MEGETVLVNVAEMIDLAIGTPELGVVDFCMLQTVLHCLAQQQRILNKNVELRGAAASLPGGRQLNTGETLKVDEFIVEPAGVTDSETPQTMLVVERVTKGTGAPKVMSRRKTVDREEKEDKEDKREQGEKGEKAEGEEVGEGEETGEGETSPIKVGSEEAVGEAGSGRVQAMSSSERLRLVTLSKFNMLEGVVQDLKNRVYGSMPKNEEILEEVRSQGNMKAISDMWQNLNVSSRLQATEEGISKLSSLVQDIVRQTPQLIAGTDVTSSAAGMPTVPSMPLPPGVTEPSHNILYSQSVPETGLDTTAKADLQELAAYFEMLRAEHDQLANTFYGAMKDLNVNVQQPARPMVGAETDTQTVGTPTGTLGSGGISTPRGTMGPGAAGAPKMSRAPGTAVMDAMSMDKINALNRRLNELEEQLWKCNKVVFSPEGNLQDQIHALQSHVDHYTKQQVAAEASAAQVTPELMKDLQGLMGLFNTVQSIQGQLHQVHETSLQLAAEKDQRQLNMNALLEQIELLKVIKLDREDMVEALADKADLRMLARKVSHDQFEMACDDLSSGLEHALGKLNFQESLWQQALDDIQREIETKLDKLELSPVKEFFNSKLKQLQDSLKQMIALRREAEAAGTKKRMLKDVNCISCDAKATMAMEMGEAVPPKPLQPNMSMKPYLTYELDAIRKSQASHLPNRNMHDWEKIDKQMSSTKQPTKVRSETDKHLCNRYCGGSHTTTTPAQRVARLGHFIKQWGPEVLPLSSKFATGDDGRLYKVCSTEGAKVGPGGAVDAMTAVKPAPTLPVKKVESKGLLAKKVPSSDCRCLDERLPKN